ncbi:uncharacterized protein LOC143911324 [Arctopsyche grandis]|uniref:uncharacterized protein LOC143911324 n=1 Tax=Arctopsyche grandis TaxID=121162 RepID=UPI00406D9637
MASPRYQSLTRVIFLICFSVIFPISQSYTVQNYYEKPINIKSTKCDTYAIDLYYIVKCINVNANFLSTMIEEEVETFPNDKRSIDYLLVQNLSVENGRLSQGWINTTNYRILELHVIDTKIESIENNAFKGFAFEELILLLIQNMKIDTLEEGTFEGLLSLSQLKIFNCEINHINENVLRAVAPNLQTLSLANMILPLNPTNLTGTVPLPKLNHVYMSFNEMTSLDAGSFSQIENVELLYVYLNQIKHVGCGTFEKMKSLTLLWLQRNLLTTLDPCVFGDEAINNLRKDVLTIGKNEWNCNCDLAWLKQLKIENKIQDNPTCASHSNLPFEKVNFCEEES